MGFQRTRTSGLYAVVVVVGADAHLAFFLLFTYFLLPHHGAALLNCSQKGRLAFTAVICVHLLLSRPLFHYKCWHFLVRPLLKGGKLGRSADLKGGI